MVERPVVEQAEDDHRRECIPRTHGVDHLGVFRGLGLEALALCGQDFGTLGAAGHDQAAQSIGVEEIGCCPGAANQVQVGQFVGIEFDPVGAVQHRLDLFELPPRRTQVHVDENRLWPAFE